MTWSQTSMQAAQPMHSYCRPLRMSMPVGQTWTQRPQSTQSPSPAALASTPFLRAPRGSPRFRVVGDDQRVRVEHHALEAGVGAHVLAHLLAHEAGHQVGEAAVEEDPEGFPGAEIAGADVVDQFIDRREVADQRKAGPQREQPQSRCLVPLMRNLRASSGALSSLMRALRSPSIQFSIHMKICV